MTSKKLVAKFAMPFLVLSLAALYGEGCGSSSSGGTGGAGGGSDAGHGTGGVATGTGGHVAGTGGNNVGTGGGTVGTGGTPVGTGGTVTTDAATDVPNVIDAPASDVVTTTDAPKVDAPATDVVSTTDAGTVTYQVTLTPKADGTDVSVDGGPFSTGSGTATVTLNPTTGALTVSGSYSGLTGAATLAHIHRANTTVIFGFTLTDTTPDGGVGDGMGTFVGTGTLSNVGTDGGQSDLEEFLAGETYLNVHTHAFPAGEIRGQVNAATPPATDASVDATTGG